MIRAMSVVFASIFSLCLCAVTTYAASLDSKKPPSSVSVGNIKGPSAQTVAPPAPKIKLNDDTLKAISDPKLPSAKIPDSKTKPKGVEAVTKPKPNIQTIKPGAPKVAVPSVPGTGTGASPTLDNARLQQIQQFQDAAIHAGIIKQLDNLRSAGELPDLTEETGIGGPLDSAIGSSDTDYNKIIRELMFGRGGEPQIGSTNSRPSEYGTGAAPGTEFVQDSGFSSETTVTKDEDGNVVSVTTSTREEATDGSGDTIITNTTVNADGSSSSRMTIGNSAGELVFSNSTDYDAAGNITHDRSVARPDRSRSGRGSIGGGLAGGGPGGRAGQGAPDDNQVDRSADPCNKSSGWGCKKKRRDPMEMLTDPSPTGEGDDGPDPGSPSVGAVAVTNEDDQHLRGSGGGGGKPIDMRDPPEGIDPDGGSGPGPAPGSSAAAAAMDSALGGLEAPK